MVLHPVSVVVKAAADDQERVARPPPNDGRRNRERLGSWLMATVEETGPMDTYLPALRSSAVRLRGLVEPLDDARLETPAYPSEWTIADVLSHLGSGAVILDRRLDDALLGRSTPDDFAPSVWDAWNAKSPRIKADDALAADGGFVERLGSLTDAERARFSFALGPLTFDFAGFVGLRLNEHALHTWDIAVVLDPAAVVPGEAAALIVDNLELVARFTAKPTGRTRTVAVRTTDPVRDFTVALDTDRVTFTPGGIGGAPAVELPAEAFVRLVYGRLDADHTPAVTGDTEVLDELRRVFPGP
jgi:uncharacterized protein (TIGR03083 family)